MLGGFACAICRVPIDSTSSVRVPLAGGDRAARRSCAGHDRRGAARASAGGRPAGGLRRAARGPGAAAERARVPDGQHRPRACRIGERDAARVRGRRLQDQLARPLGEPLTAWHYRPAALAAEMHRPHYALQALLYTVALHRYLRWRVPGYDPDAQPRRRAVPVPARDDRTRHADGRRDAMRRVRLAAAGGARARAQRVARRGSAAMSAHRARAPTRSTSRRVRGAVGPAARVQRGRRARRAPTCTSRRALGGDGRGATTRRCCWRWRSRCARRGSVMCYVDLATIRDTAAVEAEEPVDLSALPWPDAGRVARARGGERAGRRRRGR